MAKSSNIFQIPEQPFQVETVLRSSINFHEDNPRDISAEARRKLETGLEKFGCLEPVIVNRRTNNVLGGHQRLRWLDQQHPEFPEVDYELQVSLCQIKPTEETTVMTLLNNPNAQGDWDLDKLESLFLQRKIDANLAGFDPTEINRLLPNLDESVYRDPRPPVQGIPVDRPPKMAWILVGIPTVKFGEVAEMVDRMAHIEGTIVETTANDG